MSPNIEDVISSYYLYHSPQFLIYLNNLKKRFGSPKKLNDKLILSLVEEGHQVRLRYEKKIHYAEMIREVTKAFQKPENQLIRKYLNFEDLYNEIWTRIHNVKGIGPLTVYDISLRLGYILDKPILPQEMVYLTAGAVKGAIALQKKHPELFNTQIEKKLEKYNKNVFVGQLAEIPSYFLEDFFCVYHQLFSKNSETKLADYQKVNHYYITNPFEE